MQKVRSFTVLPSLPESLKDLKSIASNMFWSWNADFADLFRRIDPNLWEACNHNPVKLLGTVAQARLDDLADNEGFRCQLQPLRRKTQPVHGRPDMVRQSVFQGS